MGAPRLDFVSPAEYFRDKVVEVSQKNKINLSDDLEFYLVNLLCDFIAPTRFDTLTGELDALETPLALMLKQAIEAPPSMQIKIYKYLGDTSLYFAGFFQDYFNRKTFDVGYYISLGSAAYNNVSGIMKDQHHDEHFHVIYRDLAQKFNLLVDVVADVAEQNSAPRPLEILAVYDRWTRSQSGRLRKVLEKAGIVPLPVSSKDKQ